MIGMNFIKEDMQKFSLEYSKAIAKFLYNKNYFESGDDCYCEDNRGQILFYIEDSKYHRSYDWLMPAIEKYNTEYNINLLYLSNVFNVSRLYKSLAIQLILRSKNEATSPTN